MTSTHTKKIGPVQVSPLYDLPYGSENIIGFTVVGCGEDEIISAENGVELALIRAERRAGEIIMGHYNG